MRKIVRRHVRGYRVQGTVAQERLREVVAEQRRQQWLAENREALADANGFLSRHGLWSDGRRQF